MLNYPKHVSTEVEWYESGEPIMKSIPYRSRDCSVCAFNIENKFSMWHTPEGMFPMTREQRKGPVFFSDFDPVKTWNIDTRRFKVVTIKVNDQPFIDVPIPVRIDNREIRESHHCMMEVGVQPKTMSSDELASGVIESITYDDENTSGGQTAFGKAVPSIADHRKIYHARSLKTGEVILSLKRKVKDDNALVCESCEECVRAQCPSRLAPHIDMEITNDDLIEMKANLNDPDWRCPVKSAVRKRRFLPPKDNGIDRRDFSCKQFFPLFAGITVMKEPRMVWAENIVDFFNIVVSHKKWEAQKHIAKTMWVNISKGTLKFMKREKVVSPLGFVVSRETATFKAIKRWLSSRGVKIKFGV